MKQQKDVVITTSEAISQFDFGYDATGNIIFKTTNFELDPDINLEMTYQATNRLTTHNDNVVQPQRKMVVVMGPEGPFIANLVRILVHELGHGVGTEDSGGAWYEIIPLFRSDDDNIKQWENPWMEELREQIPRIRYSPATELCSCERER